MSVQVLEQDTNLPVLWRALKKEICEAYANNPWHLPQLDKWLWETHARQKNNEDIRLSRVLITFEEAGIQDQYEGYSFNEQIVLSQYNAVLRLPHLCSVPLKEGELRPDRYVAFHIKDRGYDRKFFEHWYNRLNQSDIYTKSIQPINSLFDNNDYPRRVCRSISEDWGNDTIAGSDAHHDEFWDFRASRMNPEAYWWHPDSEAENSDQTKDIASAEVRSLLNSADAEAIFTRVIIHSFMGGGARFDCDGNKKRQVNNHNGNKEYIPHHPIIMAPTGMTSCHAATYGRRREMHELGAMHSASYSTEPRVIIIKRDYREGSSMYWEPASKTRRLLKFEQLTS